MKKIIVTFITASFSFASVSIWAKVPLKLASDSRIEVVAYSPYSVVPIHGTTFITTQITFGSNEIIENIQNGDLGAWTASISKQMPNMLFIKPVAYGSNTNMTVVTNKHTYYFHLMSNTQAEHNQKHATYAIHFVYPAAKLKAIEAKVAARELDKVTEISAFASPSKYNWDYSFNGDKTILPAHIFDNGKFTYFQLRPNQATPAIFAVTSSSGKESVVNFRREGKYLVVLRTAPQFTLRTSADHVASIFNDKAIAQLQRHWF